MNVFSFVLIGFAASNLARRFMKNRCYSRIDDFLWGVLGAMLGDSLADIFALSALGIGANVLMAASCAMLVLLATGTYSETQGAIQLRFQMYTKHRTHIQQRSLAPLNTATLFTHTQSH